MQKYIIRRMIQAIPTLFGITLIVYFIMLLTPGDPVSLLAFDPTIRQDERERLAKQLGVNDPFYVQYLRWLIGDDWMMVDTNLDGELDSWGDNYGILRGDFGTSFKFRGSNPLELIAARLGATIELNVAVLLFRHDYRDSDRRAGGGLSRTILRPLHADIRRHRRFCAELLVWTLGVGIFRAGLAACLGGFRHRNRATNPADGRALCPGAWGLPADIRAN